MAGQTEYSKAGNPSRDRGGKKLPKERDARTILFSHNLVAIHRFNSSGLI